MGVGRPPAPWDPADYVLANFTPAEEPSVETMLDSAADAVESVVREGVTATMNRFNRTRPEPGASP
jgi:PTH1 family peptidyl-tRNA hydrolase